MSILEVPGARLHYEIIGDGPLLVMIPGATGSAAGRCLAGSFGTRLPSVTA